MKVVRMLKPIPHKVMGEDMRVYGPFEEGQNYMLPDLLAKALIFWKYAEEVM